MDGINPFLKSDCVSYPANYSAKQRTTESLAKKDIFKTDENEINKEISRYLDILFNDSDDDTLNTMDKLKLSNAYSPMKSTKLHFGNFFI